MNRSSTCVSIVLCLLGFWRLEWSQPSHHPSLTLWLWVSTSWGSHICDNSDISHNGFKGHIPRAPGHLRRLMELYLSANDMERIIPCQFGELKNLQILGSYQNVLTGLIPGALWNYSILSRLDLSLNQLSKNFPSKISLLTSLCFLNLSQNRLSAAIPPSLLNCTGLLRLSLTYTGISRSIPSEVETRMIKLQELLMFGTNLQGRIPVSLMNFSHL